MSNSDMLAYATHYIEHYEWWLCLTNGKIPGTGWNTEKPTLEYIQRALASSDANIGVVLGVNSNHLVDVDLDFKGMDYAKTYPVAEAILESVLPPTKWRFGRKSKPNSHWLYKCARTPPKTEQCEIPLGMVVELRSTGGQTVFPPSVHPSGEIVEWDDAAPDRGTPPDVEVDDLRRAVNRVALAACLLHIFPQDGHAARLAVAGWLATQGWPDTDVTEFLSIVMQARGHGDEDVVPAVSSTFHQMRERGAYTAFPACVELLDLDKGMVDAFTEWEEAARPKNAKPYGTGTTVTDYGVSAPVAMDCMDDLRRCPEHQTWYVWDGKRYRPDDEHRANGLVVKSLRKLMAKLPPEDDEARKKKVGRFLAMETTGKTASVLTFMEPHLSTRVDQFDADPWLLNVQNGILDLRGGTISKHTPRRRLVSLAAATYDPSASAPVFEKFISEMLPDDETRECVQRLAGYCLTGLTREHIFPIFHGPGANGKSTFLGALMDTMGDYARIIPPNVVTMSRNKQDRHPTELAALYKKRLAVTSESEQGKRLDESAVKTLTGGDTISVRQMREDPWDMRPTHKLILMTNYVPQVFGHDEGIWRRLVFIPCEVQFTGSNDNKNLREQLRGEFSGILNWCITGLKQYLVRGLDVPQRLRDHALNYRESQDEVLPFLSEKYAITGEATDRVPASELYIAYQTWCALQGAEKLSAKSLAPQYRGYGLREYRTATTKFWSGLRAKTKEELDDKGEKL